MQNINVKTTIMEMASKEKFESFIVDLVDYLKTTLIQIKDPDGNISYTCNKYGYREDYPYMEPFERVANFCIARNLDPHIVIGAIDEFIGEQYGCECYWLEDEKINKLIQSHIKIKAHDQNAN